LRYWNIEGKTLLKKFAARVAMESFLEEKTLLRDMMTHFILYLPSENQCDAGTDLYHLIQINLI
jgi:hypothetical protein